MWNKSRGIYFHCQWLFFLLFIGDQHPEANLFCNFTLSTVTWHIDIEREKSCRVARPCTVRESVNIAVWPKVLLWCHCLKWDENTFDWIKSSNHQHVSMGLAVISLQDRRSGVSDILTVSKATQFWWFLVFHHNQSIAACFWTNFSRFCLIKYNTIGR